MLNTINNPTGIDNYIYKLQELLYNRLCTAWSVNANSYQSYGRCYRNKTADGFIAEVFTNGAEYKEVYWDDTLKAISFFGISDQIKLGGGTVLNAVNIHLVFFVNLTAIKAAIAHRADEEARLDVLKIIGNHSFGFMPESIDLNIANVLKEYPGSRRDNRLTVVDMHPFHCFRINLLLNYNPNKNCSSLKLK
jgi:hypothetical protein